MRTLSALTALCLPLIRHSHIAVAGYKISVSVSQGPESAVKEQDLLPSAAAEIPAVDRVLPISQDNRFFRGCRRVEGLGLGEKELGPLFNTNELLEGMGRLADEFPQLSLIKTPHKTFEGRKVVGAVVGDPRVVIISGISGSERGGPDMALYFLADLLRANATGQSLVYGHLEYTPEEVATALSAGVAVLPLANPDGAVHDAGTGKCWTRNRNSTTVEGDRRRRTGVDLEYNFPFAWRGDQGREESKFSIFPGYGPQSEAETRNMMWFVHRFENISWRLSLRPAGFMSVLWGWAHADTQSDDVNQNFNNPRYRGCFGDGRAGQCYGGWRNYREYMEIDAKRSQEMVATRMASVAHCTVAQHWRRGWPGSTGSDTDEASSRYYRHQPGANRINSISLDPMSSQPVEGPGLCFRSYPTEYTFTAGMRRAGAAMMELLLHAAGPDGEPKKWHCPGQGRPKWNFRPVRPHGEEEVARATESLCNVTLT